MGGWGSVGANRRIREGLAGVDTGRAGEVPAQTRRNLGKEECVPPALDHSVHVCKLQEGAPAGWAPPRTRDVGKRNVS